MTNDEVEHFVATQVGALMDAAALAGATVRYVKPHGALGILAADNGPVEMAVARAVKAGSTDLAIFAISGTEL